MNCSACSTVLSPGEAFCGGCGTRANASPAAGARPEDVVQRGTWMMVGGIVSIVLGLLTLSGYIETFVLGTLLSIGGVVLLTFGWGLRHGALWALAWLPKQDQARPDVHHYFWGDERCPGCGDGRTAHNAFCQGCGHATQPVKMPFGQAISLAFTRLVKPQPVEPARTVSFARRTQEEATSRYLLIALGVLVGGWVLSNRLDASIAYLPVTLGVLVPPVLLLFWLRAQDRHETEPMGLLLLAFGWGIFTSVLVIPANSLVIGLTGMAQIAGFTEEVGKALIVFLFMTHRTLRKEMNGPVDGLIYGGAAGLGFAAVENFDYVLDIWGSTGDLTAGFLLRSDGILAHMIYAGLTGSFLGLMKLRNGMVRPMDLMVGIAPGGLLHAANNTNMGILYFVVGPVLLVIGGVWFFKILSESLRDEASWGYTTGKAPVEEEA